MILHPPLKISARLLPAIQIDKTWISYDHGAFVFDFPDGSTYETTGFSPGHGGIEDVFEAILSFLGAAVESRQYRERTGEMGENEDLFPPDIVDWAVYHIDEIEGLQCDLRPDE